MKYLPVKYEYLLYDCPSIHTSGSVKGMKNKFWGRNAEVIRCGSYYYNISNAKHYNEIIYHCRNK